jgi:hypothetical protein
MVAIDILKWPGVSVPFLTSFFGSLALIGLAMLYGQRRPVGKPLTWGEGMLAGTYAFGVMFLAFGIVPNAWIDHADRELGWSKDKIVYGPGGFLKPTALGGPWNPITLQYQAVRDIVVVILHALYFGLIIYLWYWWQSRGRVTAPAAIETSTYGRPLVKKT